MTTNRAYRAMEFIGDDLIEQAQMIVAAKPLPRIWTKGIAIAAGLVLIVGGACYVGIWYYDGMNSTTTERTDQGISSHPPVQTGDPNPPQNSNNSLLVTTESYYRYVEEYQTIFAKIKIDEFLGSFTDIHHNRVLLVKCAVVEDYYGTIESGRQILVPLNLRHFFRKTEEFDEMGLMDFLSEYDYFLFYSCLASPPLFFSEDPDDEFYIFEPGERFGLTATEDISLGASNIYRFLPVSDGKLDLHSIKAYLKKWNVNYWNDEGFSQELFLDYVKDGQDESVFAEYIRENKEKQIKRENEE